MFKYRVMLKVSYNEAWFEFDDLEEAGEFAKSMLIHQIDCEDTRRKSTIRLEVVDTSIKVNEDDDE